MDCDYLFKCLFNITKSEIEVYKIMLRGTHRIDEIVELLGKERSTIQRCLFKLISYGMVTRQRKILHEGGGHYYVYGSVPPQKLKKWLNKCIDAWYKDMNDALKNIDEVI